MTAKPTTHILCFGDSNTWGYIPGSGKRYSQAERWSGLLATELQTLGTHADVVEDGVSGRTTQYPVSFRRRANASRCLAKTLTSLRTLDFIVLALGINDMKIGNASCAAESAQGMKSLLTICQQHHENAAIILISPPHIPTVHAKGVFSGATERSKQLGAQYAKLASEEHITHIDADSIIAASPVDGIHFDPEEHQRLARDLAAKIHGIRKYHSTPVLDQP